MSFTKFAFLGIYYTKYMTKSGVKLQSREKFGKTVWIDLIIIRVLLYSADKTISAL